MICTIETYTTATAATINATVASLLNLASFSLDNIIKTIPITIIIIAINTPIHANDITNGFLAVAFLADAIGPLAHVTIEKIKPINAPTNAQPTPIYSNNFFLDTGPPCNSLVELIIIHVFFSLIHN